MTIVHTKAASGVGATDEPDGNGADEPPPE
jgi:hypothetical protein